MQTTEIGRAAERVAAHHLESLGYTILDRNWRHKRAEIDIVAQRGEAVHFIEVKYRRADYAGSGLDYVTPAKQRQMAFAADLWLAYHRWHGSYELGAIEVSGPDFEVTGFVETLS